MLPAEVRGDIIVSYWPNAFVCQQHTLIWHFSSCSALTDNAPAMFIVLLGVPYLPWAPRWCCSCCWGRSDGRLSGSNLAARECCSDTAGLSSWNTANRKENTITSRLQGVVHQSMRCCITKFLPCSRGSSVPPGHEDSCSNHRERRVHHQLLL